MKHLEDAEQAALFNWAATRPELRWMHAIPNGGRRDKREAARLKAQGVKAGVCDIFLPLPVAPFHGLYVEMKRNDPRATTSAKQREFIADMIRQGYRCAICRGWLEAREIIEGYLNER